MGDQHDPAVPSDFDSRCRAVVNVGTRGFGPSCNLGARLASGRFLLFLNDDVVVSGHFLAALAEALVDECVVVAGPDVRSARLIRSESGTELSWHHGVLEARQGALSGAGQVEVPYVCGAALAVRRRDFETVGGFDERLAPYFWEDVDLSLRLCRGGGRSVIVSGVSVEHRHGTTVNREPGGRRRATYERNRFLVSWKHLRRSQWLPHLAWLPLRLAADVLRQRGVLPGFMMAMAALPRSRGQRANRG